MRCEKCGSAMEQNRRHRITPKILNQPHFYAKWYVCKNCGQFKTLKEDKIINDMFKIKFEPAPEQKIKPWLENNTDDWWLNHLKSIRN